jgi:hypothetical protein
MALTYPICDADGNQIDIAEDVNPVIIDSDEECIAKLEEFLAIPDLTEDEVSFLNICLQSIKAQEGEDVEFGFEHQAQFFDFIMAHSDYGHEIAACAEYLNENIDQILDPSKIDDGFVDNYFAGDVALAGMLSHALKREEKA